MLKSNKWDILISFCMLLFYTTSLWFLTTAVILWGIVFTTVCQSCGLYSPQNFVAKIQSTKSCCSRLRKDLTEHKVPVFHLVPQCINRQQSRYKSQGSGAMVWERNIVIRKPCLKVFRRMTGSIGLFNVGMCWNRL